MTDEERDAAAEQWTVPERLEALARQPGCADWALLNEAAQQIRDFREQAETFRRLRILTEEERFDMGSDGFWWRGEDGVFRRCHDLDEAVAAAWGVRSQEEPKPCA